MSQSVRRTIRGFHVDDEGQWVAELSCFHNQHVRHRPPFENRPWVLNNERRAEHIGTPIDCTLCFDGELPTALKLVRSVGPFDETNLPNELRAPHEIADGRWGLFRVGEGATRLILDEQSRDVLLQAGEERAMPPAVVHHLEIVGHVSIEIDFLAPR
jgi:tellurite methyltransferase